MSMGLRSSVADRRVSMPVAAPYGRMPSMDMSMGSMDGASMASMSMNGESSAGRPMREAGAYIRINKEVTNAAKDPQIFQAYIMKLCEDKRKLSMVNVVTILQRAGRNRMKLEQVVVKYLADACADLRGPGNELRPQAVGSALYGLQRLGDGPEVRELVMALTMKVRDSQEPLDAQAVGNALYGLQTLGDSPEARALVGALTPRIACCTEELKAQHVGNALYGLQRLGDSPEVMGLLAVLVPMVKHCKEEMRTQAISNALYGVHRLSETPEVRQLMSTLP